MTQEAEIWTAPSKYGETKNLPRMDYRPAGPGHPDLVAMVGYFNRLADWSDPLFLTPSNVTKFVEFRPGVYRIWLMPPTFLTAAEREHWRNGGDPNQLHLLQPSADPNEPGADAWIFDSWTRLAYVGESNKVRTRLYGYAEAHNPDRPPVYQVIRDRVLGDPELAHKYLTASPQVMRQMRRLWMRQRGLWVQVAYTESKEKARELERTMISYCDEHNLQLWNTIKYTTGVTWPSGPKLV